MARPVPFHLVPPILRNTRTETNLALLFFRGHGEKKKNSIKSLLGKGEFLPGWTSLFPFPILDHTVCVSPKWWEGRGTCVGCAQACVLCVLEKAGPLACRCVDMGFQIWQKFTECPLGAECCAVTAGYQRGHVLSAHTQPAI